MINDLNCDKIIRTFYEKSCRRQTKQNLESEKSLKEKEISFILNRKVMIILPLVGLIKRSYIK